VPLRKIQTDNLHLLVSHHSADIDVFHDREDRVAQAAREDAAVLTAAGYSVRWLRQTVVYTAEVALGEARTRLDWVVDSDFRFFPTVPDEVFGFILHPVILQPIR
jgi:hypothetical protein